MSIIKAVTTGVSIACDLVDVIDAGYRLEESRDGNDRALKIVSLANKIVMTGLTCAGAGAALHGASSETCSSIKQVELASRICHVPIRCVEEVRSCDGSVKGTIACLKEGLISPLVDVARVVAEQKALHEEHFLEMSPEELALEVRVVDDVDPNGNPTFDCEPVTEEGCRANLAQAQKNVQIATIAKAAIVAVPKLAQIASNRETSRYESVVHFVRQHPSQRETEEISLLSLSVIPPALHGDIVFSRYICPITQAPIRHPVGDPNGHTLYERREIVRYLQSNPISSMTRAPLTVRQLVQKPALQALIDHRLRFHEERLQAYLAQSPALQQSLGVQPEQPFQQAANVENPHN